MKYLTDSKLHSQNALAASQNTAGLSVSKHSAGHSKMNVQDKQRNILFLCIVNLLIIITGILYLKNQHEIYPQGPFQDLGYILLLILSSAALSFGYYQIKVHINNRLTELTSKTGNLEKKAIFHSIANLFSLKRASLLIFLFIFSTLSFVSFYSVLDVWGGADKLKLYLSTFQFFVGIKGY